MYQDSTTSQEYLLLDYVQRLERHRQGRRAVHIHLSQLKPQNRREHHIRIAANTFEDLVKQFEGQIFSLSNADLVFVCKGASPAQMDEAVTKLRYLFSEDPLTQAEGEDDRFCSWYNVEGQYPKFLALAEQLCEEEQKRARRVQAAQEQGGGEREDTRRPLGPQQLGKLEEFLQRADLSSVMRRQPICAIAPESAPRPIFKELFISIGDLARTVLPDVNLATNRWLFQHLTQTLDRRVLKLLSRADDTDLHSAISINLNVETLLSPAFLEFDASLRMGSRGTIVVELQLHDVMGDVGGFMFARDFVREKGYRVCLDGVTGLGLPLIDRQKLGVDMVKLIWAPSMGDAAGATAAEEMRGTVERAGKARLILARCDTAAAIRFGQSVGITMFQGRHIDAVLQNEARKNQTAQRLRPRR